MEGAYQTQQGRWVLISHDPYAVQLSEPGVLVSCTTSRPFNTILLVCLLGAVGTSFVCHPLALLLLVLLLLLLLLSSSTAPPHCYKPSVSGVASWSAGHIVRDRQQQREGSRVC